MKNIFKKIYYNKYTKTSYSISGVDLVIDRMFSKMKKMAGKVAYAPVRGAKAVGRGVVSAGAAVGNVMTRGY